VKLFELKKGDRAIVKKIDIEKDALVRLNLLGFTENVIIKVVRFAPLGDPIEILVRDTHVAIRKSVAKFIVVEKVL